MNEQKNNLEGVVLKQLRDALGGISQEALSRLIGCSAKKIWRGENGIEITWTTAEAKRLDALLEERFDKTIRDLPDSLKSSEPIPFLQSEQQKSEG